MLSADGRFSGMVPPSSLIVRRTFSPTSRWVALALALPVIFSRRSLSSAWVARNRYFSLRDDFLGWVRVLNDEVAGVAGEHHDFQNSPSTAADFDHLVGTDQMVLHPLSAVDAGGAGFLDDALKVAVIYIAQDLGQVAA